MAQCNECGAIGRDLNIHGFCGLCNPNNDLRSPQLERVRQLGREAGLAIGKTVGEAINTVTAELEKQNADLLSQKKLLLNTLTSELGNYQTLVSSVIEATGVDVPFQGMTAIEAVRVLRISKEFAESELAKEQGVNKLLRDDLHKILTDANYIGGVQYWIRQHDALSVKLARLLAGEKP